jgi:mono/diheme cytochrome c family protein
VRRLPTLVLPLTLAACSWFTDFKQQPKLDPWETPSDTIPMRANPQRSIPITGAAAPEMIYPRRPSPAFGAKPEEAVAEAAAAVADLDKMSGIANPIPADSASVSRGRLLFQINCSVCHGARGEGGGRLLPYTFAMAGANLAVGAQGQLPAAAGYTDGKIFGIIRNGKRAMPSYARIEDNERWDIINYLRSLQGKVAIAADTSHGRPGETGPLVPGASRTAPTRPAPYFHPGAATRGRTDTAAARTPPPNGATPPARAGGAGQGTTRRLP